MMSEPPAKRRKSRFGSEPTQDKPSSSNVHLLQIHEDLQERQNKALEVAKKLSNDLGIQISNNINGITIPKVLEKKIYIPHENYPYINFIGLILGPKGINQKRMQAETGCRILVKGKGSSKHPSNDQNPNEQLHVYLSSDNELKLQKGVDRINELIGEATSQYKEGGLEVKEIDYGTHIDIEIPNSQIGVVIGKQGSNLERIQNITGAQIDISRDNLNNNPIMKMITINGKPSQCQAARNEIMRAIEELRAFRAKLEHKKKIDEYNKKTSGDQYQLPSFNEDLLPKIISGNIQSGFVEIEIPNNIVGLIIGKNASNVKAMKDRTKCDIRVQKDEDTAHDAKTRGVCLKGTVSSIELARQEIAKVIHGGLYNVTGLPNSSTNTPTTVPNTPSQSNTNTNNPYMMQQQLLMQQYMQQYGQYNPYIQQSAYQQQYNPYGYQYQSNPYQPPPPPPTPNDTNNTSHNNTDDDIKKSIPAQTQQVYNPQQMQQMYQYYQQYGYGMYNQQYQQQYMQSLKAKQEIKESIPTNNDNENNNNNSKSIPPPPTQPIPQQQPLHSYQPQITIPKPNVAQTGNNKQIPPPPPPPTPLETNQSNGNTTNDNK